MKQIYDLNITGKTILEIGTGGGGTTLEIVDLLREFSDSNLITTDIEPIDLTQFLIENPDMQDRLRFVQTDATILKTIQPNSIDIVIGNYVLAPINSISGKAIISLEKFYEVLKNGGMLLLEDEYPITMAQGDKQELWAEQWSILKKIITQSGQKSFNELDPAIVKKILKDLGFHHIEIEKEEVILHESEVIPHFQSRMDYYMELISHQSGFDRKKWTTLRDSWIKKMKKSETLEIPSYLINAIK